MSSDHPLATQEWERLYREAWARLALDRTALADVELEGTPVLAFGRWQTSRVVTAGLNPSEIEFRADGGKPLAEPRQRFLHWPADGALTTERLTLARHRAEGYFSLGNAYTRWFGLYDALLDGMGVSFKAGTACHTDYLSPFATRRGIARCDRHTREQLAGYGSRLWTRILDAMPQVQVIFGHGTGIHLVPGLLGFSGWEGLATPLDQKGGRTKIRRPFLRFQRGMLPESQRPVLVYWWLPNMDGAPLTWLNREERVWLGRFVRDHARAQGVALDTPTPTN
jgi:hypothetical protein